MPNTRHHLWVASAAALLATAIPSAQATNVRYVVHVSVDGLRPDVIINLGALELPNFYRMRTQGTFTDNARSDYYVTVTLPNHVTQLTGRPVSGADGHQWESNSDPAPGATLHSNKGSYVAGVCDVVHDNGSRTALYASKSKFSLFEVSWDAIQGAPDTTGADDGRDKIDRFVLNGNTGTLVNTFFADMQADPYHYSFIHLTDPDTVGHSEGWDPTPGSAYSNVIKTMDQRLGRIFDLIDTDARLAGRTALIVTADHGGEGSDHSNASLLANYRVPFYVWGPGVSAGTDLYTINAGRRLDPGTAKPPYAGSTRPPAPPLQPVRNGDAANLALDLLGLGPVPGSSINAAQDLRVPEPATFALLALGGCAALRRRTACTRRPS